MKKIVFMVGKLGNGGAERVTTVIARYFVTIGYDVHIVVFSNKNDNYISQQMGKIHYMNSKGNRYIQYLKRMRMLNKFFKVEKPDALISLRCGYSYFAVLGLFDKYKIIFSERNDPKTLYKTKSSKTLAEYYYQHASHVVFQTMEAAEFFSPKVRMHSSVIPNPLMTGLPQPYTGERSKRIVTYCRLEKQKNLSMLLEAFSALHEKHPEYVLEIYGRGSLKETLEMQAVSLGIQEVVSFLPFNQNIHQVVVDATMYVNTSDFEGMSNAMIESMAIGLPVVCTDCPCGGARACITDHENGLLVSVGNREGFTRAMLELIESPETVRKLSQNAVKIRAQLSEERICKQWDKLINA